MVNFVYQCEKCKKVFDDESKAAKHEQQPLTGLEFKVGSVYGLIPNEVLEYDIQQHIGKDEKVEDYLGKEILIISRCEIVPNQHERIYSIWEYIRGPDKKNTPIESFNHLNRYNISRGRGGEEFLDRLRELDQQEYDLALKALNAQNERGNKEIEILKGILCKGIEISKGILPKT